MKATIALAMFVAIPAVAYAGEVHTLTATPPHVSVGAAHQTTIGSATGGAGGGRVTIKELSIHKATDQASPKLFLHAVSGKHFKEPHF